MVTTLTQVARCDWLIIHVRLTETQIVCTLEQLHTMTAASLMQMSDARHTDQLLTSCTAGQPLPPCTVAIWISVLAKLAGVQAYVAHGADDDAGHAPV